MSLVETVLLNNSVGLFPWETALESLSLFYINFLLFPLATSERTSFSFPCSIFPHSTIIQHLLKFLSLQFKVAPTFSCVSPPPSCSVSSVGTAAERCMTGDVGRDSYTPWLPLQTFPSLTREILAKLQMLELHIRLALLIYMFATHCVKFYASEEMKSSLQNLHQTKNPRNYKIQNTQITTC